MKFDPMLTHQDVMLLELVMCVWGEEAGMSTNEAKALLGTQLGISTVN